MVEFKWNTSASALCCDVNTSGGNLHTIKNRSEGVVELNADTTKYMVMSCDQNAGRRHNMKTDNNRSYERVEELKY
jgi:hypothetical protein